MGVLMHPVRWALIQGLTQMKKKLLVNFQKKSSDSPLVLYHTWVVGDDVGWYGKGVGVGIGVELIGGTVEGSGEDDVVAFFVEPAEVGPSGASEGELFSAFCQDEGEGLIGVGGAGREGTGSEAVDQEG